MFQARLLQKSLRQVFLGIGRKNNRKQRGIVGETHANLFAVSGTLCREKVICESVVVHSASNACPHGVVKAKAFCSANGGSFCKWGTSWQLLLLLFPFEKGGTCAFVNKISLNLHKI